MKKIKSLVFRVDASIPMGTGHVMRCLALAQSWQDDGGEIYFCTKDLPIALVQRLATEGINQIESQAIPGSIDDAVETIDHCRNHLSSWLVLDGYHFDAEYQAKIKAAGLKLLVIDDHGHANSYCADLILNQNVCARAELYPHITPETKLLLGCEYTLLRREFWSWRGDPLTRIRQFDRDKPLRILITLGGSDPYNTTFTILSALKYIDPTQIEINVIVGGANPHIQSLQSICAELGQSVQLHSNVTDMPALMARSDLAISAGGGTCWELALIGIPALLILLADNQRPIVEELARLEVGINLGWHQTLNPELIATEINQLLANRQRLTVMSQKALELVDGYGSDRTIEHLKHLTRSLS
jgi:UDP-2,4-diacetamido-2,4,6-trideoxy-beta-L-altropyranose hydrolase